MATPGPTDVNELTAIVVEDHPVFAMAMTQLLTDNGFTVKGTAMSVSSAIELLAGTDVSLVVCDLGLSDGSGMEVCRWLVSHRPGAKIVMVSGSTSQDDIAGAVAAGAVGFITKHSNPVELGHMLRAAAAGESVLDKVASAGAFAALRRSVTVELSDRERKVLQLLDSGLNAKEVAAQLFVSVPTVKTHVGRAAAKLGTNDRNSTLAYARRQGLLMATA